MIKANSENWGLHEGNQIRIEWVVVCNHDIATGSLTFKPPSIKSFIQTIMTVLTSQDPKLSLLIVFDFILLKPSGGFCHLLSYQ
jgi:hypothetical protein